MNWKRPRVDAGGGEGRAPPKKTQGVIDMAKPQTFGVHHLGFTVPDVRETRGFFVDVLGFEPSCSHREWLFRAWSAQMRCAREPEPRLLQADGPRTVRGRQLPAGPQ